MNHMYARAGLLRWAVVGALAHGVVTGLASAQASVTLDVSVLTEQGVAIDGLPVTAFGDAGTTVTDTTDVAGAVTLTLARPTAQSYIVVALSAPSTSLPRSTYLEWASRRLEVMEQRWFEGAYSILLVDGVSEYSLTITGYDAVSISGRATVQGSPVRTGVGLLGAIWGDHSDRQTGVFSLGGVRKSQRAAVMFVRGYGQEEFRFFDAAQTAADIDVGDIALAPAPSDSRLDLDVSGWEQVDHRGRSQTRSVSLVRDDGTYGLTLKLDENNWARLFETSEDDLQIPAGTYYVAPGPLGPNPISTKLVWLVHEGVVDLDAAGVPKVAVSAGQVTTMVFDAPAAEAAISAADE